jgi:hypothetical protein
MDFLRVILAKAGIHTLSVILAHAGIHDFVFVRQAGARGFRPGPAGG